MRAPIFDTQMFATFIRLVIQQIYFLTPQVENETERTLICGCSVIQNAATDELKTIEQAAFSAAF